MTGEHNSDTLEIAGHFNAIIDGAKCHTLPSLFSELARAFRFPDYFGGNYDALWECLTDLEWIDAVNYALIIDRSAELLSKEPSIERDKFIKLINDVAYNWRNVPNYAGEEAFRKKADFRIILR
jgi:RNAse (barnase) inhibitor barstar